MECLRNATILFDSLSAGDGDVFPVCIYPFWSNVIVGIRKRNAQDDTDRYLRVR
jgi:hypothetical protein